MVTTRGGEPDELTELLEAMPACNNTHEDDACRAGAAFWKGWGARDTSNSSVQLDPTDKAVINLAAAAAMSAGLPIVGPPDGPCEVVAIGKRLDN